MFQFPGLAFDPYVFRAKYLHMKTGNPKLHTSFPRQSLGVPVFEGGFPHSEISGSKLIRSSPKLIAAYHVLLRLLAPRHPPNALKTLDRSHRQCPPPRQGLRPRLTPGRNGIDASSEKTSFASCRSRTLSCLVIEQCSYSRCHTATHLPPAKPVQRETRKRISRGQLRALPPCPIPPERNGGARRDRTDDLMLAKHALSQLSYGPINDGQNLKEARTLRQAPQTGRTPSKDVRPNGDPTGWWWAWDDSNVRPHPYQGCALTT